MIRTITKIGNSQGIIFDSTVMDLAQLKVGDQVWANGATSMTLIPSSASQAVEIMKPDAARKADQ